MIRREGGMGRREGKTYKKSTPPREKNVDVSFLSWKKMVPMMIAWIRKAAMSSTTVSQ